MARNTDGAGGSSPTLAAASLGNPDNGVSELTIEQIIDELNVCKDRLEAGGEPPEKGFEDRLDALKQRGQSLLHGYRTGSDAIQNGSFINDDAEPADIAELSYKEARAELDSINHRMEAGGVPLHEAFELLKREDVLDAHCRKLWEGFARAAAPVPA